MHRDPETIQADIDELRNLIASGQHRLAQLEDEVSTARAMERTHHRNREHVAHVLARMESGESVVATPRTWWHRDGQLIERATPADMDALFALQREGLIEKERR